MLRFFLNWQTAVLLFVALVGGLYLRETYTIVPVEQTAMPVQQTKEYADAGEGAVTLSVTVDQFPQTSTVIRAALNTHSVNLDAVDFGRDVWIEKNGAVVVSASHQDDGGGHHRTSAITFPYTPLPFTVVGQNIGGITRRAMNVE